MCRRGQFRQQLWLRIPWRPMPDIRDECHEDVVRNRQRHWRRIFCRYIYHGPFQPTLVPAGAAMSFPVPTIDGRLCSCEPWYARSRVRRPLDRATKVCIYWNVHGVIDRCFPVVYCMVPAHIEMHVLCLCTTSAYPFCHIAHFPTKMVKLYRRLLREPTSLAAWVTLSRRRKCTMSLNINIISILLRSINAFFNGDIMVSQLCRLSHQRNPSLFVFFLFVYSMSSNNLDK